VGGSHEKLGGYSKEIDIMTNRIPEMFDMMFELGGETPSAAYPFSLWAELLRLAPQLAEQRHAGILPLRLPANSEGMLLQKRARLILRLPAEPGEQIAAHLTGQEIVVNGRPLHIGKGAKRLIQAYPTVHAQMVAGASDEVLFMADINTQLSELGVAGNLICGRKHVLTDELQSIQGYSLVIHDLKPDASLKLQYAGLGGSRRFGCGIFVPYKVISGLSDD